MLKRFRCRGSLVFFVGQEFGDEIHGGFTDIIPRFVIEIKDSLFDAIIDFIVRVSIEGRYSTQYNIRNDAW